MSPSNAGQFRASKSVTASVVGPGLSAVRAACALNSEQLAGLAPVFERIGQHLDATMSRPATDERFRATGRGILVAVSDVRWQRREFVLITEFGVDELGSLIKKANEFYDSCETTLGMRFETTELSEAVCACWIQWSRHAYKSFRRRIPAWDDSADIGVASLLLAAPDLRQELVRIAVSGDVPVLAVALNSAHATASHLKCNIRYLALSLPAWARASGVVAGRA
jgi:hypothetical protein